MLFAILAAISWWFSYAIDEKIVHKLPLSLFILYESIIFVLIFWSYVLLTKQSFIDLEFFKDKTAIAFYIFSTIFSIAWTILIVLAIKESNATVAGLIEISYPIFIILATYILFREHHLNIYVIFWWIMIFTWIGLIYLKGNT